MSLEITGVTEYGNLPVVSEWTADLPQIETNWNVLGGSAGAANVHAKVLGNRTQWLKDNKADKNGNALNKFKVAAAAANDEAVNRGQVESLIGNAIIPSGVITMWSGSVSNIPTGWFLCNGQNGTPDLRNRFIYGASADGDVGVTGGSKDAVVVSHSHTASSASAGSHTHTANHSHTASSNTTGSHNHSYNVSGGSVFGTVTTNGAAKDNLTTSNAGNHSHTITVNSANVTTSSAGAHSHSVTVNSAGVSGTNKNLPPYMKLAYIMKG